MPLPTSSSSFPQKNTKPPPQKNSQPPPKAKSGLSVQAMLTFIVALLTLNAIAFLFLSIQFSMNQAVIVVTPNSVDSKLNAIQAKLASFEARVNAPADQQAVAMADVTYSGWDFTFAYPKGFTVALFDDEFTGEQKDVRITSQKGSLFRSSGGPAEPGPNEFESGYEMRISKLHPQQDPVGSARLIGTTNPIVQKIDFFCDGAGCSHAEYLVTTKKGRYIIEVDASNEYSDVDTISAAIISTIAE